MTVPVSTTMFVTEIPNWDYEEDFEAPPHLQREGVEAIARHGHLVIKCEGPVSEGTRAAIREWMEEEICDDFDVSFREFSLPEPSDEKLLVNLIYNDDDGQMVIGTVNRRHFALLQPELGDDQAFALLYDADDLEIYPGYEIGHGKMLTVKYVLVSQVFWDGTAFERGRDEVLARMYVDGLSTPEP